MASDVSIYVHPVSAMASTVEPEERQVDGTPPKRRKRPAKEEEVFREKFATKLLFEVVVAVASAKKMEEAHKGKEKEEEVTREKFARKRKEKEEEVARE